MNLRAILALSMALAMAGCKPVNEETARSFATDRFKQVCADFSYQQSLFAGPFKTDVGNTAFAYEWHTRSVNGLNDKGGRIFGVLVSVKSDGDTEVAWLDEPPK